MLHQGLPFAVVALLVDLQFRLVGAVVGDYRLEGIRAGILDAFVHPLAALVYLLHDRLLVLPYARSGVPRFDLTLVPVRVRARVLETFPLLGDVLPRFAVRAVLLGRVADPTVGRVLALVPLIVLRSQCPFTS